MVCHQPFNGEGIAEYHGPLSLVPILSVIQFVVWWVYVQIHVNRMGQLFSSWFQHSQTVRKYSILLFDMVAMPGESQQKKFLISRFKIVFWSNRHCCSA